MSGFDPPRRCILDFDDTMPRVVSSLGVVSALPRVKMKTAMMIANIDRAMEELRAEYETKEMVYKYDAFKMHYIDGVSYEEIADIQNCGKNTPSRWSKELIRKMSVKLFGIDGVEKY